MTTSSPSQDKQPATRLSEAITDFTRRIRAIKQCASEHITIATQRRMSLLQHVLSSQSCEEVKNDERGNKTYTFKFSTEIEMEEFRLKIDSTHPEILSESLLIFGFSAFDAFLGTFLKTLYREVPQLLHLVVEKTVKVGELLTSKDLPHLIDRVIEKDVSTLLRNSYSQQFDDLANRHGLSTLKKFDSWCHFAEAAQRRNLITHCNGVVNENYLENCKKDGVNTNTVAVGSRLQVSANYLGATLDVLYEVGFKLAHILWRKSDPKSATDSSALLSDELFELLQREELWLARKLGEFALSLSTHERELQSRISRINYAQALKWSGEEQSARKILDEVDWSGSIRDLRLGVNVLLENYKEAAELMIDIGPKGELVREIGYREWPVFREFRKTSEFRDAFFRVYGKTYGPVDNNTQVKSNDDPTILSADSERIETMSQPTGDDMPSKPPVDMPDDTQDSASQSA